MRARGVNDMKFEVFSHEEFLQKPELEKLRIWLAKKGDIKPDAYYPDSTDVEVYKLNRMLPKVGTTLDSLVIEFGSGGKLKEVSPSSSKCMMIDSDVSRRKVMSGAFIVFKSDTIGGERTLTKVHRECARITGLEDIYPARGLASLRGLRWLRQADEAGTIDPDMAIVVNPGHETIARKIETGGIRGRYTDVWKALIDASSPYREAGRLLVTAASSEVHNLAFEGESSSAEWSWPT